MRGLIAVEKNPSENIMKAFVWLKKNKLPQLLVERAEWKKNEEQKEVRIKYHSEVVKLQFRRKGRRNQQFDSFQYDSKVETTANIIPLVMRSCCVRENDNGSSATRICLVKDWNAKNWISWGLTKEIEV